MSQEIQPGSTSSIHPRRLLFLGVILLVILCIIGFFLLESKEHLAEGTVRKQIPHQELTEELPVYETVPETAEFTERSGRRLRLGDLRGEAWVASFIFTECRGTCPIMTASLKKIQDRLESVEMPVRLVSFTVDPKRDDPQKLSAYADEYDAEKGWYFLTAPDTVVQRLAVDVFKLGIEEGTDPDEPIIHSSRFILIDAEGQIRGYFDGTNEEGVEQLMKGIRKLEAESGV